MNDTTGQTEQSSRCMPAQKVLYIDPSMLHVLATEDDAQWLLRKFTALGYDAHLGTDLNTHWSEEEWQTVDVAFKPMLADWQALRRPYVEAGTIYSPAYRPPDHPEAPGTEPVLTTFGSLPVGADFGRPSHPSPAHLWRKQNGLQAFNLTQVNGGKRPVYHRINDRERVIASVNATGAGILEGVERDMHPTPVEYIHVALKLVADPRQGYTLVYGVIASNTNRVVRNTEGYRELVLGEADLTIKQRFTARGTQWDKLSPEDIIERGLNPLHWNKVEQAVRLQEPEDDRA
jgi:hypothetical protein